MLALTNLVARLGAGARASDEDPARQRARIARLEQQLQVERTERAQAENLLAQVRAAQRDTGRALRAARKSGAADEGRIARPSGIPDEAWIRDAVSAAWEERVHSGDRSRWPLRDYRIGTEFAASLTVLDDAQLTKALRACVDALTGRDRDIASRDLHRLRAGNGGDDPYVSREDGARCWRSAIEQRAASARRLHYWELRNGVIELGRVVLHDDTRP